MSSEKSPEIDPRFDPAFQRGFDPTIPIEEYVPPVQPRRSAVATGTAPTAASVVSPEDRRSAPTPAGSDNAGSSKAGSSNAGSSNAGSHDSAVMDSAASTATAPGSANAASPSAASGASDAEQTSDQVAVGFSDGHGRSEARPDTGPDAQFDASVTRNPFLLVIGVIAVALVGAGIWLFVLAGDAFNSTIVRSQGDYMSLDATIHAAPFLALLGGATAIGVLFVFAVRYRRRR